MSDYKKTKLKNGIRVITVPMESANSVACFVLVATGSKHENKENMGISHFLEHMFFKGTKKRPSTLDISEVLDNIGGQYNAFTSKEMTGYWAKVDKKHADVALDWISDIFLNSTFPEEEIQREKGVIIEELNMYLDTPTIYVTELWEELLYGDQPAGWRIIGTKETINSFDRKKITDYFHSHYSTENMIICVAGGMNGSEMIKKVEQYFGETETRKVLPKNIVLEKQSEPGILIHKKETDQTHFCLGVRAYDLFDDRKYALALLSVILGGNMSSRLFIKVRERNGLAYSIHTAAEEFTDSGFLVTQARIDGKNLEKSVQLILEEYKDIKENGVLDKELKKAKDYIKGSMALSLDASDKLASFYGLQELLEGNIATPEEKIKKIDVVSVLDIKKIAKDIFVNEKLNLAVIGNFENNKKEELKNILKI